MSAASAESSKLVVLLVPATVNGPDALADRSTIHTIADFAHEVATLCAITVTPQQWEGFLDAHVPRLDAKTGEPVKGRALALADRKRDALNRLYRYDERVAPWGGTAQGVIKAVNTHEHHEAPRRDRARWVETGAEHAPDHHW